MNGVRYRITLSSIFTINASLWIGFCKPTFASMR